jgi:hypothetical protein
MHLIYALAVVAPSVCWLISSWKKCSLLQRSITLAFKDSTADKRAGILRAAAELAGQLFGERFPGMLIGLLSSRRRSKE